MNYLKVKHLGLWALTSLALFSCKKEDEEKTSAITQEPIVLDCNFFEEKQVLENTDAAVDYIINCQAYVNGDLIIEPGVVIHFEADAGLGIIEGGSIKAVGTEKNPIVFTGKDEIPGSWSGIYIESLNVKNKFEYCTISFGGGKPFNSNGDKGNIIIYAGGRVDVSNSTISNSATNGLNLSYSSSYLANLKDNLFTENDNPIYTLAYYVDKIDNSNRFEKNANSFISIGASKIANKKVTKTWMNQEIPYRVFSTNSSITKLIRVDNGENLIIDQGTTIEFSSSTGIDVRDGASLKIIGTANSPILLTGVDKAAGAWGGVAYNFTQHVNNEIAHTTIEYAADADWEGAIYTWADPRLNIHDCTFKDLMNCAIFDSGSQFDNPNLTLANNKFINSDDFCHN